jgi:hypothetical protein
MKRLLVLFIFTAALFSGATVSMAIEGECIKDAAGKITISAAAKAGTQKRDPAETAGDSDAYPAPYKYSDGFEETEDVEAGGAFTNHCSNEPDFYKVKFFKVALCPEDPYSPGNGTTGQAPDFSSCAEIFSNTNGKDVVIEPGVEVNLLEGDLIIPIGSYKHLAVVVSNHLKIKHTQQYVYEDASTAVIYGNGDLGTNSNTDTCYTIDFVTTFSGGKDDHSDAAFRYSGYNTAHGVTVVSSDSTVNEARMKCVESSAVKTGYDYATEIIDHFGNNATLISDLGYEDMSDGVPDITGLEMAGTMLQDDNLSVATSANNAKRIGAFFRYAKPVIISEETIGFKLNFATTLGVSVDGCQADDGKIWMCKVGADPFTIQIQTKTKRARAGAWR